MHLYDLRFSTKRRNITFSSGAPDGLIGENFVALFYPVTWIDTVFIGLDEFIMIRGRKKIVSKLRINHASDICPSAYIFSHLKILDGRARSTRCDEIGSAA